MSSSTLLDQIAKNEITELRLSNDPDDYFEDPKQFVDAMKTNTSIETVCFDNDFLSCCNGKDRKDIVEACGMLANVESVLLNDSAMMIGVCVTSLITNAKKLKVLSMENCVLQGIAEDFEAFEKALQGAASIKTLRFKNCSAANPKIKFDQRLASYKNLPSISVVEN
jgi:hypothetical protein